jgi:hypothetical protein
MATVHYTPRVDKIKVKIVESYTHPSTQIIVRQYNNVEIPQRISDRYMNATKMCKANGKLWGHYWENQSTQEFVSELSAVIGIPITGPTGLIQVRQGGTPQDQGTWVHPEVAIDLAKWCSVKFRIQVNRWILELLTTGKVELEPKPTQPVIRPWGERLQKTWLDHRNIVFNKHSPGHWTVYTATSIEVLEMEDQLLRHLFKLKGSDMPDISIGLRWSKYIMGLFPNLQRHQDCLLILPQNPDRGLPREVYPYVYPHRMFLIFQTWMHEQYLPAHMHSYFRDKFTKDADNKPFLACASAADHACRQLTGLPALLKAELRQPLLAAGGMITCEHSNQLPDRRKRAKPAPAHGMKQQELPF